MPLKHFIPDASPPT